MMFCSTAVSGSFAGENPQSQIHVTEANGTNKENKNEARKKDKSAEKIKLALEAAAASCAAIITGVSVYYLRNSENNVISSIINYVKNRFNNETQTPSVNGSSSVEQGLEGGNEPRDNAGSVGNAGEAEQESRDESVEEKKTEGLSSSDPDGKNSTEPPAPMGTGFYGKIKSENPETGGNGEGPASSANAEGDDSKKNGKSSTRMEMFGRFVNSAWEWSRSGGRKPEDTNAENQGGTSGEHASNGISEERM